MKKIIAFILIIVILSFNILTVNAYESELKLYRITHYENVSTTMINQVVYSLKRFDLYYQLKDYYTNINIKKHGGYFGLFYPGSYRIEVFESNWYWNWYPASRGLTSNQLIWKVVYHEIGHGIHKSYEDVNTYYARKIVNNLIMENNTAKTHAVKNNWRENFAEIFSDRLVGKYRVDRNEYKETYKLINSIVTTNYGQNVHPYFLEQYKLKIMQ